MRTTRQCVPGSPLTVQVPFSYIPRGSMFTNSCNNPLRTMQECRGRVIGEREICGAENNEVLQTR
jgi:hypothetical protein